MIMIKTQTADLAWLSSYGWQVWRSQLIVMDVSWSYCLGGFQNPRAKRLADCQVRTSYLWDEFWAYQSGSGYFCYPLFLHFFFSKGNFGTCLLTAVNCSFWPPSSPLKNDKFVNYFHGPINLQQVRTSYLWDELWAYQSGTGYFSYPPSSYFFFKRAFRKMSFNPIPHYCRLYRPQNDKFVNYFILMFQSIYNFSVFRGHPNVHARTGRGVIQFRCIVTRSWQSRTPILSVHIIMHTVTKSNLIKWDFQPLYSNQVTAKFYLCKQEPLSTLNSNRHKLKVKSSSFYGKNYMSWIKQKPAIALPKIIVFTVFPIQKISSRGK